MNLFIYAWEFTLWKGNTLFSENTEENKNEASPGGLSTPAITLWFKAEASIKKTNIAMSSGSMNSMDNQVTSTAILNKYDIARLGIDDSSGLGQTKSKSSDSDGIITIEAQGEGINVTPVFSDMASMEFLTWANNNSSLAEQTTEIPPNEDINGCLFREWDVQQVGETGLIDRSLNSSCIIQASATTDINKITNHTHEILINYRMLSGDIKILNPCSF